MDDPDLFIAIHVNFGLSHLSKWSKVVILQGIRSGFSLTSK